MFWGGLDDELPHSGHPRATRSRKLSKEVFERTKLGGCPSWGTKLLKNGGSPRPCHSSQVKGLQSFVFEEVILPDKDHKISIHAQHNEHLKCLVIEESVSIGHGQVRLVGVLVTVLYL